MTSRSTGRWRWLARVSLAVLGLVTLSLPTAGVAHAAGGIRVSGLEVNHQVDPLGIGTATPRLSWRLDGSVPDVRQSAYQVRVASDRSLLARGVANVWNTGKVASGQSTNIAYGGPALHSRQRLVWQVRVWDNNGAVSGWSAPATWEMGLLHQSDWSAQWISNSAWLPHRPTPAVVHLPAQNARYLRLNVTKLGLPIKEGWPYKVSRLQLAEIVVVNSANPGTDLALHAPVTASQSYTVPGDWAPQYLTDGSLTSDKAPFGYTSYQYRNPGLSTPIWIQLDLGQVRHFDEVLLYPRTDLTTDTGKTPNFPVDYTVQTANRADGPFTVAATVTGQVPPPPLHAPPAALPIFAKQFQLGKPVRSARLYLTGLGIYVATVNGRPVGPAVLEPGNTDYRTEVQYRTYDVTHLLHRGGNAIGVQLGNGIYNVVPTPGRYAKFTGSQGTPRMIAQLEVTYADGTTTTVDSDSSWRTTLGPTTTSTWYGGEDYDARRLPADWDLPGTNLSGPRWSAAVPTTAPAPTTQLVAHAGPPIEVVGRFRPKAITQPKAGVYVFDMGTNFAGWEQLRVSGPAGTTVTMRPGELLNPDGTVYQSNSDTGTPIFDSYTLSGHGVETWHPQFAYHGFRYLQVTGLPSPPAKDTITGLVLRAANPSAGDFTSSNPLINSIHSIINRAVQSNMQSIVTDCPDREKLGWLEDGMEAFPAIADNYDVAAYEPVIVRNMAEAQTSSGLVPDIAPEYTVFSGPFRDDPNWGDSMIIMPWQLYRRYGDVTTMRTYYPNMQRYLAYLTSKASGNLLAYGLGDWGAVDTSTPTGVTASYAYYRSAKTMSQVATVLGHQADAARYTALTRRIAAAFNAKYLNPGSHTYANGTQADEALALNMGVVPASQRQAVLNQLVAAIAAKGNHVDVGEVALTPLLQALQAGGRNDVLYAIATQTTYPSYGFLVRKGATALTEYWSGPTGTNSQDHEMLGGIDDWFTSGLAGIQQSATSVAYRDLVIKPAVVGDLTHVQGSYRTPHGTVDSSWTRLPDGSLRLDVTIPANSTATIDVPASATDQVTVGGPRFAVSSQGRSGGYAVYRAGSGHFSFVVHH